MYPHSLKINIAITIAVLLLIAMILIDFVMVIIIQRDFLQSQVSKGRLFSLAVERELSRSSDTGRAVMAPGAAERIDGLCEEFGVFSAVVMDEAANMRYSYKPDNSLQHEVKSLADRTIRSGAKETRMVGMTWGVFWLQKQYLIVSEPLYTKGNVTCAVGVVYRINEFYSSLREIQQFVLIYVLTNMIILTLFGLYRMHQLIVKPLNRLVERAEEYSDEDGVAFIYEKEKSEIGVLSRSLNQMLKRISGDKEKLHLSLSSLEKANIDLKKAQKEIIRAEKLASVGRLSAGIAHEIGNPIGIVLGYIELLKQQDISDDEKNDFLLRSEKEVNRINGIIRQLLDFSRPSSEILENISVHKIIDETISTLKVQPIMMDIQVSSSLQAENDTVFGDSNQLGQIFLNLIINAADALFSEKERAGGEIEISTRVEVGSETDNSKPDLIISFDDNGHGIPEAALNNIFDPFYTTKDPGKGTGLGLSVCFMIVDQMGGSIKAHSKEGRGTTMTVRLPLVTSGSGST